MAISPEWQADRNPVDFRAPPPSPIASGRRSSVANDDFLTEFLQHSLRVPDLILPNRAFPRQNLIQNPPRIDFQNLDSPESDAVAEIIQSIDRIGCFQVVNHGIARELVGSVSAAGAGVFGLPPENKAAVVRSLERSYGFEESQGDEEREMGEEFVWGRDERLDLEMEGIWPLGYSNFSEKMDKLVLEMEKVAGKIFSILKEHHTMRKPIHGNGMTQLPGSICYLYKHGSNVNGDEWIRSLRYDVMRMLIRGSDDSHSLCLHLCDRSSEFHVYSKKGWGSFCPQKDAIVVTLGDQIQAWSGGKFKHVIGRPIFKGEVVEDQCISMAFLYSPANIGNSFKPNRAKTISLAQQAIVAMLLTLVYRFWVYVYNL
ncbi:Flavonol synthase/flavanone 3-hydroxylase [Actinidia chinensis var. chinensis]|uniref:Flavonol synthase/flavanone 3-hydroxylase n=1 Tax=Actinidia chinensis var. chinensis TaxID=1590841 RepID=A0A2R6QZY2_ACTCC|nr:Flavonol synthase/flavanone 3-hydroxylase [Actinidia chinensis var. chinensis]